MPSAGCQTGIRGASGVKSSCLLGGMDGRARGRAGARVRDAIRGSAVSTWPRLGEREATTKRPGPPGGRTRVW